LREKFKNEESLHFNIIDVQYKDNLISIEYQYRDDDRSIASHLEADERSILERSSQRMIS